MKSIKEEWEAFASLSRVYRISRDVKWMISEAIWGGLMSFKFGKVNDFGVSWLAASSSGVSNNCCQPTTQSNQKNRKAESQKV